MNTVKNRRLMLPITKIKVEGTELTELVDTRESTSFFRQIGANRMPLKSMQARILTRYVQLWAKRKW